MKFYLLSSLLLFVFTGSILAQKLIAVQNGGTPSFFTTLEDAYNNAQNGDTIYLPGGNFGLNTTISKRLHIIGVGHNPDSTSATFLTVISGTIAIGSGADNGSITGILFGNSLNNIFIINDNVTGFSVSRCFFETNIIDNSHGYNFIYENRINYISLADYSNTSICNNIILGEVSAKQVILKNNIFTHGDPLHCTNCLIENNIFYYFYNGTAAYNCLFRNNVNCGINGVSLNNQGSGNYPGLGLPPDNNIFVNYTGSNFYSWDFHLIPGSTYHNAGTDGTDIGIYGGLFPWKDGSLPYNPHVQFEHINGSTELNGNLNVNIRVKAQDH